MSFADSPRSPSKQSIAPVVAPVIAPPRPLWHKDIAQLDTYVADEAADVLHALSKATENLNKANVLAANKAGVGRGYANLLAKMKGIEEDAVSHRGPPDNPSWLRRSVMGLAELFFAPPHRRRWSGWKCCSYKRMPSYSPSAFVWRA